MAVDKVRPKDFIGKPIYHGGPDDLTNAVLEPLKHASGRTPLPGFYGDLSQGVAKNYGPNVHEIITQFDDPKRIVHAKANAPQNLIAQLRESLPEEGPTHYEQQSLNKRPVRFREKFDMLLEEATEKGTKPTYHQALTAYDRTHIMYKPLESYESERMLGAVEMRKYGIDAMIFEEGGGTMGLLDPHDVHSKVGRTNIKSIRNLTSETNHLRQGMIAGFAETSLDDFDPAAAKTHVQEQIDRYIKAPAGHANEWNWRLRMHSIERAEQATSVESLNKINQDFVDRQYLHSIGYGTAPNEDVIKVLKETNPEFLKRFPDGMGGHNIGVHIRPYHEELKLFGGRGDAIEASRTARVQPPPKAPHPAESMAPPPEEPPKPKAPTPPPEPGTPPPQPTSPKAPPPPKVEPVKPIAAADQVVKESNSVIKAGTKVDLQGFKGTPKAAGLLGLAAVGGMIIVAAGGSNKKTEPVLPSSRHRNTKSSASWTQGVGNELSSRVSSANNRPVI